MNFPRPRRALSAVALTAVLVATAACGTGTTPSNSPEPDGSSGSGTAGASESVADPLIVAVPNGTLDASIVAELYIGALTRAGVPVEARRDVTDWEQYGDAVREGRIDVVPGYTGELLYAFDATTTARESGEVSAELREALPESLAVLDTGPASRQPLLAMTQAGSAEYEVTALSDLGEVCEDLGFGGPQPLLTRADGIPELREDYDCDPSSFTQLETSQASLEALINDRVQVAELVNTDPSLEAHGLVVLEGSRQHFMADDIVPVVHQESVGEEAREVLNRVTAELTVEDLIQLNIQRGGDAPVSASAAAETWLTEHGFEQ
ncbi:ABC transporter substrate-binding protein [Zhihengliuella flava]|uniref:Osmoprotectant transport system substrate-binding protein n=1 Tax=Zhihengliuella flava TaxID=1285193 RepID=A0A931DDJ8_9MICC|nr:osmoprotectant transport system substrate-binding protein [Zhihengliuella flava]